MPAWYWLGWAVFSAIFAVLGAVLHNGFLLVWNLFWLGLYIYLFEQARAAGK